MSTFRYTVAFLLLHFLRSVAFAQTGAIIHNDLERTYLLHVPPAYDGRSPLPLVIALHGGFGNALNLQRTSELSEKADASEFIVVYPEGVRYLGIRTWNAGNCCGRAAAKNIDDVGFIAALIDTLSESLNIDSNRIFATGMSNGGMLAYRLACEIPDRIAAIAPVAATMAASECNPTRPVPIIHFHSFLDTNVPLLGGLGSGPSGFDHPSLDSVLTVWADKNTCTNRADTLQNDDDFAWLTWSACEDDAELHLYLTRDGGHSWPGGKKTLREESDPTSVVINADDLMWAFFQTHPLSFPTSVDESRSSSPVKDFRLHQNYPNPFNSETQIEFAVPERSQVSLRIFNLSGQLVRTLKNEILSSGTYSVTWDGRDDLGKNAASGVYLYRMRIGTLGQTRKMILIR